MDGSGPIMHPLLHSDILPLILIHADDRTLARLMRTSRHVLSHIVTLRWPRIALSPSPSHDRPRSLYTTRTTLPDQPHWFSHTMQLLLARYAPVVIISPHPAYTCPPRLIRSNQAPVARVLQIDKRGLCRSDSLGAVGADGSESARHGGKPCALSEIFMPSTLRIDHINQHPIIPLPYGLSFASTLTRLLLFIDQNTPSSSSLPNVRHLHECLPDHFVDITFVLLRTPADRPPVPHTKHPDVNLPTLCKALAEWISHGKSVEGRVWTIVAAEKFGKIWAYEDGEGQALVGQAAVRRCLEIALEKKGEEPTKLLERIRFVPLRRYLATSQTRSELAEYELKLMWHLEYVSRQKVSKSKRAREG